MPDLINHLLGIDPHSPLAAIRAQRAEIATFIQASYDALLAPPAPAGISLSERAMIALRVAHLSQSEALAEHYRHRLHDLGETPTIVAAVENESRISSLATRQRALLEHAELLTNNPAAATPEHLAHLQRHGFSEGDIVTIAQLIAFLSFQVRVMAGLQLFAQGDSA